MRKKEKFRFWNLVTIKETRLKKKAHGYFFGNSSFLDCRKSLYTLWNSKLNGFGKGTLSRSEPLFSHPNPSFNSIGRASREKDTERENSDGKRGMESLNLNESETFYLFKQKVLEFQAFFKKKKIWKMLTKNYPTFLWKFNLYKKFRTKNFYIRSGVKFGGNFLIYKEREFSKIHSHSIGVVFFVILGILEKKCTLCFNKFPIEWEDIQNRTRLTQQVSKKFFFVCFGNVKKRITCFCKKTGAAYELLLQRWSI